MAVNQRLSLLIKHQILVLFLLAILLFTHLPTGSSTHKITNYVTSYPAFQHLNVPRAIASTKLHKITHFDSMDLGFDHNLISISHNHNHLNSSFSSLSSVAADINDTVVGFKLKLIHRDKVGLSSKYSHNGDRHQQRFSRRIQRDVKRVSALVRRLSNMNMTTFNDKKVVESFGSDIVSGMDQGSGEYFVRIGVGSPPRKQYMVIDSGSDIVWLQCQPCNQCYRQTDPVFNPSDSTSFSGVSCSSSACSGLQNSGSCHSGSCRYEVSYNDGSYTKGTMALETLTVGSTTIRNVAIGCGHSNRGMFVGAAGLLGLGGGSMSFVGQLGGQTGGAFSYCLVSRGTGSTGSLVFGRGAMPVGAAWINLLRSPRSPGFYYVGLTGLGVGGARVSLPEGVFGQAESGDGGTVMDTGTAVTRLPPAAYEAFRDAFLTQTASLPRASGVSIFDTCYNLGGFSSVRVPTVSLYFAEGPILTLPARNFLIPVDEAGTFCFAFAPSPSGLSIIGNIQQEGIQISIDAANGFVGFGPSVC